MAGIDQPTKRIFEEIGRAVVHFQQLELWLSQMLAMMLKIRHAQDQHLISAAMSYGQKLDLFMELYPTRRPSGLPEVDLGLLRRALCTAEEYRNRVVHSFWGIECSEGDNIRWVRIKGSLKGRKGLKVSTVEADADMLAKCNQAIYQIRDWYVPNSPDLKAAVETLDSYMVG